MLKASRLTLAYDMCYILWCILSLLFMWDVYFWGGDDEQRRNFWWCSDFSIHESVIVFWKYVVSWNTQRSLLKWFFSVVEIGTPKSRVQSAEKGGATSIRNRKPHYTSWIWPVRSSYLNSKILNSTIKTTCTFTGTNGPRERERRRRFLRQIRFCLPLWWGGQWGIP